MALSYQRGEAQDHDETLARAPRPRARRAGDAGDMMALWAPVDLLAFPEVMT